jgi:hypothetical protein
VHRRATSSPCGSGSPTGPSPTSPIRARMISARRGISKAGTIAPEISSVWPPWPA